MTFSPIRISVSAAIEPCIPLLLLLAFTAVAQAGKPNVLFLLTDDQRPDTIAHLGNDKIVTPNLDALAKRGVAFTRAVCANPICTPSRAEILTGCSGFENHVLDFGKPINKELTLWPQAMKAAGYRTYYVGKWHNDGSPTTRGFDETLGLFRGGGGKWWKDQTDYRGTPVTGYRGWVFQDDVGNKFPDRGVGLTPDISEQFADAAISFITREKSGPWFLQVNFTAPHDPLFFPTGYEEKYDPKEMPLPKNFLPTHPFDHGNFEGRDEKLLPQPRTKKDILELLAVYYAVISHVDKQVGRILKSVETMGQTDNTIVIFSSDHGLGVGSHGLRGKQNMYEHTINVPLIIAGPKIPRDKTSAALVYLRDLYPTICDMADVKTPDSVTGKSFAKVIAGEQKYFHPHVFCYFRDKQRMLRTDRFKIIHYPAIDRWQLFDLKNDPYEMNDLSEDAESANVLKKMKDSLMREQREVGDTLVEK